MTYCNCMSTRSYSDGICNKCGRKEKPVACVHQRPIGQCPHCRGITPTEEKPQLPIGHVLLEDAARLLKKSGYDITYNGLYYYRRLGILPEPERLAKSKFKYYDINALIDIMFIVDFLRGVFHFNTEQVALLIKAVRLENVKYLIKEYFNGPYVVLHAYGKEGKGGQTMDDRRAMDYLRLYTSSFAKGLSELANMDHGKTARYDQNDCLRVVHDSVVVVLATSQLTEPEGIRFLRERIRVDELSCTLWVLQQYRMGMRKPFLARSA